MKSRDARSQVFSRAAAQRRDSALGLRPTPAPSSSSALDLGALRSRDATYRILGDTLKLGKPDITGRTAVRLRRGRRQCRRRPGEGVMAMFIRARCSSSARWRTRRTSRTAWSSRTRAPRPRRRSRRVAQHPVGTTRRGLHGRQRCLRRPPGRSRTGERSDQSSSWERHRPRVDVPRWRQSGSIAGSQGLLRRRA